MREGKFNDKQENGLDDRVKTGVTKAAGLILSFDLHTSYWLMFCSTDLSWTPQSASDWPGVKLATKPKD